MWGSEENQIENFKSSCRRLMPEAVVTSCFRLKEPTSEIVCLFSSFHLDFSVYSAYVLHHTQVVDFAIFRSLPKIHIFFYFLYLIHST